jgi:hypothetical protein
MDNFRHMSATGEDETRPKKIPTVKFRIKPEASTASAPSSANIIVLPATSPGSPAPDPHSRWTSPDAERRGTKRKADGPLPLLTTFDSAAPDLQVNSTIPLAGGSWEHSLSLSHEAVGAARGKKKERATRKDKGVPRKRKGITMSVGPGLGWTLDVCSCVFYAAACRR